jgi:hypothetical protein
MMEKFVKNGLVCFFDIMGYQNILLKNGTTECAKLIKEILIKIPEDVKDDLLSLGEEMGRSELLENFFVNNFHKVMISDTIILFFDLDEVKDDSDFLLLIVLLFIRNFQYNSFINGLPMRASLDFGEYYYFDNLFAGETIVNAYTECNKLNFSGVIITKKAYEYLKSLKYFSIKIFLKYYIFECLVPLKQANDEAKYILKWYVNKIYKKNNDVKQFIFNSFYMHNKDVGNDALIKINNTEKTIRFFILQEEPTVEKIKEEGKKT